MEDWKRILQPIDRDKLFWTLLVVISVAILTGVTKLKANNIGNDYVLMLYDIITPLTIAVLGSFFLNIVYKVSEFQKLKKISSVAYDDLLPSLLDSLDKLNGKYRKDAIISATISKYSNPKKEGLYQLVIEYNYKTIFKNSRYMEFMFKRLFEDDFSEFTNSNNNEFLKYDAIFGMDERAFPKDQAFDTDYALRELMIDSTPFFDAKLGRNVKSDTKYNTISYRVDLSNILLESKEVKEYSVRYVITMPVGKEDVHLIQHDFPTHKGEVSFDYTDIKDEINVYGIPVTGSVESKSPDNSSARAKLTYGCSGWILPKQGYIFSWRKK